MADNVIWSTIFLGNFADMDTDESTYTQEDTSALLTTFGSGPGNALANNIVDMRSFTVETDDSVVHSDNFPSNDYLEYDLGAGTVTARVDSMALVHGIATFYGGATYETDFRVIQTDTGDVFLLVRDDQPELASAGLDTITFSSVVSTYFEGVDQTDKSAFSFVCFAPGTRIDTPLGARRVDRLRIGEHVTTLDDGPQPIRWIGKQRLSFAAPSPAQPVRIAADAFAPGLPRRAMLLSPNHRVLVETSPSYALHDPLGALAPAKGLTRQPGIRVARGKRAITYFSLLLPVHAVILAEGVAVESLYPGPQSWAALTGPERSAWLRLAPQGRVTGQPPARLLLTAAEARAGLESHHVALPATAPRVQMWSARRRRLLPLHLARV